MSFIDDLKENISNVLGGKSETVSIIKQAPKMSQRMDVFELPEPPEAKSGDYLEAMRGWVYIAVKAISQEVAKIELVLYRKRGGKVDMVPEHEMLDLIDRVNPFMTKGAFLEAIQSYLELVGEAFVWKYKEGKSTKQMWILRPDFIEIMPPVKEGEYIGGYKYKVPGMKSANVYPVDQIIHFKEFNPTNPYRGLGPLQAAAYAYDTDLFASKWNRNFFYNNAMPTTLLTTEQNLKGKDVERIRSEWENKFGGVNKAHKMAILTGGLKVDDVLKQSIKDMDFLNLRKFSRDEIFTIFQVPKTIVSITEDVNRANAREGKAVWIENVIKPKMSKLVSFLNEFYVPEWGEEYYLGYKDPSPESIDMNIKLVQVGAGILTINERRELLDYDEIEGGDVIYTPTDNSSSGRDEDEDGVDDSNDQTDDDGEGKNYKMIKVKKKEKAIDSGVIVHHKTTTADKLRRKILEIVKDKGVDKELKEMVYLTMNSGKDERVKVKKKDEDTEEELGVISQDKREGFWKAMILRSEPQELQFGLALKMYWMKQMKRLLNKIETGKGYRRVKGVDNYLYDVDEENNILVKVVDPLLKKIIAQAGGDALKLLGVSDIFDFSEEVEDAMNQYGLMMADSINETTRAKLREVLIEGIANHESIPELSKRVRGVYDDADKSRASMIARTETMRANNLGHLEGYKQSGVVEMKEWMVALDERTCQYCLAMEKEYKRVGLDDNFLDLGESLIGLDGGVMKVDYSGLSAPPLHPSCRCVLLPVVRLTGKALIDRHEKVKQLETARKEEEVKLEEVKKKVKEVASEVEAVKKEKLAEVDKQAELVMSKKLAEAKERKRKIIAKAKRLRQKVREKLYE